MNSQLVNERLAELERACRARGQRATVQKRAVLRALLECAGHPTADAVYERARRAAHGISRATVYRLLEQLVDLGLASRQPHPGSSARFDANLAPHHHLLCTLCGMSADIDAARVAPVAPPDTGRFAVENYTILFRGVCGECRSAAEDAS